MVLNVPEAGLAGLDGVTHCAQAIPLTDVDGAAVGWFLVYPDEVLAREVVLIRRAEHLPSCPL